MRRRFYYPCGMNGAMRVCMIMQASLVLVLVLVGASFTNAQDQFLKVKVRMGDVSLNKLPFVIAYEEGIYKKNGLEVDQLFTRDAVEIVRRSGVYVPEEFILKGKGSDLPISIGGASPMMVGLTTKAGAEDPVILASTDQMIRWRIISQSNIANLEQLKGKRLGYSGYGAVTHFAAISFAKTMGWDPNYDLSLLSDALNVESLQKGYTDAFVASELHATMAVAAGFKELVDLSKYNLPNAGSSVQVNRAWLKTNQETARRFIKSTVEAIALLKKDKKAAFSSLAKWYNMKDPKLQEYLYREVEAMPKKPYPPYEGIKKAMEIYDSHEMRKYRPDHFYNDSFVRQLDESGYIDSLYK